MQGRGRVEDSWAVHDPALYAVEIQANIWHLHTVRFFEKRARKASWFAKAEEKVCWEQWVLNVTLLAPSTDSSMWPLSVYPAFSPTMNPADTLAGILSDLL